MSKADVSSPGGVAVDDLGEIGSLLVAAMKAIAEARPLKIGHLEAVHDALRAAALRDPQLKHVRKAIRVGLTLNDALGVPPSQEQRDTILKAWFYLYAVCRLITRDLSQLSVEDKPLEACCQCEAISWAIEYLEQFVALWRDSWKTTWRIGHPEEDMPVTSSLPNRDDDELWCRLSEAADKDPRVVGVAYLQARADGRALPEWLLPHLDAIVATQLAPTPKSPPPRRPPRHLKAKARRGSAVLLVRVLQIQDRITYEATGSCSLRGKDPPRTLGVLFVDVAHRRGETVDYVERWYHQLVTKPRTPERDP